MLALADWANDEGKCWYSINKIATRARVSRRQAIRILGDLEEKGMITKDDRFRENGSNTSNVYTINITLDVTPSVMGDTPPSDMYVTPLVSPVSPQNHHLTNKKEPII